MSLNNILIIAEVIALVGAVIFGALWYFYPSGSWEPLSGLCGLFIVGAEVFRRITRKSKKERFESNGARIQHRETLRKQFQDEIYKCRAEDLRKDVIVRHVDRVDNYPDVDDKDEGISPWFRVGLIDTYERGIVLCLRLGGLKECQGGYRFVDYVNEEKSDITAMLLADVPYDSIEAVNMEGDKYYNYPHIYCYFDFNGEPYERKWFAQKIDQPHGHPYFKQIAEYHEVIANNPNEGTLFFG